jgi:UDPglucose 6-dehydrogenase
MKLSIVGQATLAEATRVGCISHFSLVAPDADAEVIWICYDTPIQHDIPDPDWVHTQIRHLMPFASPNALMLVSSQMPVGTIRRLEEEYPAHQWAYSPENIRVKTAIEDFKQQARIIVGSRRPVPICDVLFAPFTSQVIHTDPETAEMCKHALNAWLGMNIAFINEIARVAQAVGADPSVISAALLSEPRVGPRAPLKAGAPFGGGHLSRDIRTLTALGSDQHLPIPIIAHIHESNAS